MHEKRREPLTYIYICISKKLYDVDVCAHKATQSSFTMMCCVVVGECWGGVGVMLLFMVCLEYANGLGAEWRARSRRPQRVDLRDHCKTITIQNARAAGLVCVLVLDFHTPFDESTDGDNTAYMHSTYTTTTTTQPTYECMLRKEAIAHESFARRLIRALGKPNRFPWMEKKANVLFPSRFWLCWLPHLW